VKLALLAAVTVALVLQMACATAASALSNDGTVTVEWSGTVDQSFVYQPENPSTWQGTNHFEWDAKETFALSGREEDQPTSKQLSRTLSITGTVTNIFAPPNDQMTCTGTLSARGGDAPDPISFYYGGSTPRVGVSAYMPRSGYYIQSSAPDDSKCGSPDKTGGPGFVPPEDANATETTASPAMAGVAVPSDPYSMSYGGTGSDRQTTESFHARLQVTTNGDTGGAGPRKLTPAQIRAKMNVLDALKETLPAGLYPCFSTALGTTLITSGPPGAAAGGTLIAIAGPLCKAYYTMLLAEIETVKDPPRSDYRLVAHPVHFAPARRGAACKRRHGAALRTCKRASVAAADLVATTRTTASVARAIKITMDRETGARRAHSVTGVRRQDHALAGLNRRFLKVRKKEAAAGAALARIIRRSGAEVRLTTAQAKVARRRLLKGLSSRGLSAAHRRYAGGLFKGHALDVLAKLGR
jgi:hypothetical protein